jgi:hypothetical protein
MDLYHWDCWVHWAASDANDFEAEHEIYHDDAVLEYPQFLPGADSCAARKKDDAPFRLRASLM